MHDRETAADRHSAGVAVDPKSMIVPSAHCLVVAVEALKTLNVFSVHLSAVVAVPKELVELAREVAVEEQARH